MYKFTSENTIHNTQTGEFFPTDPTNPEYQAYLKWSEIPDNVVTPLPEPAIVYPIFTGSQKLALFGEARRGITAAAMTDVDVKMFYDELVTADHFTYSDPRAEMGLQLMVEKGLLNMEEKAAIVGEMTKII